MEIVEAAPLVPLGSSEQHYLNPYVLTNGALTLLPWLLGEYLEVASIVPRTSLVAALILAIGRDPEVRRWREAGPAIAS